MSIFAIIGIEYAAASESPIRATTCCSMEPLMGFEKIPKTQSSEGAAKSSQPATIKLNITSQAKKTDNLLFGLQFPPIPNAW